MESMLRERGWRIDCKTWMQKVWHKENLISRVSVADGQFPHTAGVSPFFCGTGECALENVQFISRGKYELIPLADVPPVVFSETMRDIDISSYESRWEETAFQASQPILNTRIAVAREMLSARSIKNVTFHTEYAQITGAINVYLVHMGTGAVYKPGMVKIKIPPATTAEINRIFIPCYYCDAETTEILSKILLLANDKKIKDIKLLEQLETFMTPPPF